MRRQIILPMLTIALGLVGCGFHIPNPVASSSGVNLGGQAVVVDMWASDNLVQPGETVKFRATVTNKTAKTFSVDLKDLPVLDIVIYVQSKTTRWSDGKALTSDLTHLELKPGESKAIEMDYVAKCCDVILAYADFRYGGGGLVPGVTVFVKYAPGGALP